MKRILQRKINPKLLIIPTIGVLIAAALFLSTQTGGGKDVLSEAIEGGELTLTSVGRNYESLTKFVQNNETQARQLLDAARVALESAKARLSSARRTSDEYVLGMVDNYWAMAQASDVMAQGVDNLLAIRANLTNAIYCYLQNDYEEAAEKADYCLQVLTPLLSDFETFNASLNGINVFYVPSGQRDQLTHRVDQYSGEMEIYNQYVLLLRSLSEGKGYLELNSMLEEYLKQLQSALANGDYQIAEELRQKISEILQSLKDSQYQRAAKTASQLDPSLLGSTASAIAQALRNRLRMLLGIEAFETYLQSLEKFNEALIYFGQGGVYFQEAEEAINEGLEILGPGRDMDSELQGLYEGLRAAFNTLRLRIREQPPPG